MNRQAEPFPLEDCAGETVQDPFKAFTRLFQGMGVLLPRPRKATPLPGGTGLSRNRGIRVKKAVRKSHSHPDILQASPRHTHGISEWLPASTSWPGQAS